MSTEKSIHKKCGDSEFRRLRYFHGMLMTDDHFSAEQAYHNNKRRLLNRMLHGWGVVCGLKIKATTASHSKISIERGLALDCNGNEIFVCPEYTLDISDVLSKCSSVKKRPATSEECDEAMRPELENKWYVVIKYKENHIDPLPVYALAGGCEEKVCEYSRTNEGFCVDLVKTVNCPERLKKDDETNLEKDKDDVKNFLCEKLIMGCPGECCKDPFVVLGSITTTVDLETKKETLLINNWDCRRYVITFGLLDFWMRQLAPQKLPFEAIVNYVMQDT